MSSHSQIPQSEHPASLAHVETNESVSPSAPQPSAKEHPYQSPVPDKASVPDKVSAPSPLRISLNTTKKTSDVGPSIVKLVFAHHLDSVIYGDEVISIEDDLKYPYHRKQLPLFSIGIGVKGHFSIRTLILFSFKRVHTASPALLNLLGSGLKNRLYIILGSYMTAARYFLMSYQTSLL